MAKLDAGESDAILLACAGLQRLGFDDRIRARLDAPEWLPAPAQGAIAVECRDDAPEIAALLAVLDDAPTRTCVEAERALNRRLDGSCHVPIAAFARLEGDRLHLQGLVASVQDGRSLRRHGEGDPARPEALGERLADELQAAGARELIAAS